MTPRRWISGTLLAVLVVGGCGAPGEDPPATPTPNTPEPATAPTLSVPFDESVATELDADVASGDETRVRDALAIPEGQPLEPGFIEAISAADLTIDPTTLVVVADDYATAHATATGPDGQTATWLVDLVVVDGRWTIAATATLEPAP